MPATIAQRASLIRQGVNSLANYISLQRYSFAFYRGDTPVLNNMLGGEVRFSINSFDDTPGGFVYELGIVQIEDGETFNEVRFVDLPDNLVVTLFPLLPAFVQEYTASMAQVTAAVEAEATRLTKDEDFDPVLADFNTALQGFNALI